MALTAAEILDHPAFGSVVWDLQPRKKGIVSVAASRGGPFNIVYEIHGDGPIHLLVC